LFRDKGTQPHPKCEPDHTALPVQAIIRNFLPPVSLIGRMVNIGGCVRKRGIPFETGPVVSVATGFGLDCQSTDDLADGSLNF
jgi:hypothetical protein